jgi:transcriptional regulator with XRE-family HTH domain
MDVIKRIDTLMKERSWTDYKLSVESGLSSSTIANIHRRHTVPSIPTLEAICNAFGITLSQFFNEDCSNVQLNEEQQELFNMWVTLTENQKKVITSIIKEFK